MTEPWLTLKQGDAPLLVSFPHTGMSIPAECAAALVSFPLARHDADRHIDKLYAFATELGATTVHTALSRTVIDVNRDPSGASLYPGQTTTGLVPTETFDGRPLYRAGQEPTPDEIERRKALYFAPYHLALAEEIKRLRAMHPRVVLYDCHSIRSREPRLFPGELPVFNIGTNAGKSCEPALETAVARLAPRAHGRMWSMDGSPAAGSPAPMAALPKASMPCRWSSRCAAISPARTTRRHGIPISPSRSSRRCAQCSKTASPLRAGNVSCPGASRKASSPGETRPGILRCAKRDRAYARMQRRSLVRDTSAVLTMDRSIGNPPMPTRLDNARVIRAARGPQLSAKSWLTEAPLRMLMNNLDPEVAEKPHELVVYGGIGRAARDWESFDRIVAALRDLEADETLCVQSGKPVGVFRTHADAPRVLIANSNLVPHWATLDHFNELDRKGLMMYGQMTAGSWIYIGSQGIVQGTYETFAELLRRHYGGSLAGKWILTAGLGGMGGAQPLAATMAGASLLAIECQPSRIEMRLKTGYLDAQAKDLDEALAMMERASRERKPISVGVLGNAAEMLPELVRRGVKPDAVTDQTSAHDPINGYLPAGWTLAEWEARRADDPKGVERAAKQSMAAHVRAMLAFWRARRADLRLRQQYPPDGEGGGRRRRVRFPRLRAGLCPPAVLPRHRPVPLGRAVGRSRGHFSHRRQGEGADAERRASAPLARHGARRASSSRACRRASAGSGSATGIGWALPSTRWWRAASSRRRS